MEITLKEKVESVGKKIHLAITVSLFFPVLVKALFDLSDIAPNEMSGTTLQLGLIIQLAILNFLLFEWQKFKLTDNQLFHLNIIVTVTILSFLYILFAFAFIASEKTPETSWVRFYFIPHRFLMSGYFYLPFVSFLYMIFVSLKNMTRKA